MFHGVARHVYTLMVAFFLTHEVDAALRHEWRVLPLTSFLPDAIGREVFLWGHVPIFAAVFWLGDRAGFRRGLAAFAVMHVGLHWLFRNHPAYEFDNPTSWLLILIPGALGAAYLVISATAPVHSSTRDGPGAG